MVWRCEMDWIDSEYYAVASFYEYFDAPRVTMKGKVEVGQLSNCQILQERKSCYWFSLLYVVQWVSRLFPLA
jgi:hypothetical protein